MAGRGFSVSNDVRSNVPTKVYGGRGFREENGDCRRDASSSKNWRLNDRGRGTLYVGDGRQNSGIGRGGGFNRRNDYEKTSANGFQTSSAGFGGIGRGGDNRPKSSSDERNGFFKKSNEQNGFGGWFNTGFSSSNSFCGGFNNGFSSSPNNFGRGRGEGGVGATGGFGCGFAAFSQPDKVEKTVDAFETKPPSKSSNDFYSKFGGGFSDFSNKDADDSKPTPLGVGFNQDWALIEAEMKKAEAAKWASLPPILKEFYQEDPEITAMTEDEADVYRLSRNNIMVQDAANERPVRKPVKTFVQAFRNQPEILSEIAKQNFVEPSPIQSQMWPIALMGYDVIGIAQTGTGKTLGFLLPIFVHLDCQPLSRSERNGPGCLILSPTRELALQIRKEVKKFNYKGIKSICIYGGGSRKDQMEGVLAGVDIIIATPGRLNDLVCADVIKLRSISFLVLDEADRMLDMGFEPQIRKILMDIRPDRQTIMTSATWPKEVRELGDRYTKNPFIIIVGSLDLTACHSVTQVVEVVDEDCKRERLFEFLRCLKKSEKVIVFVAKKSLADDLSSDLLRLNIKCACLHGDRDQSDREQALEDIKNGKVQILVATDVASRGLDIVDITHVYNYDFPRHMEEYVHRVGRTGRAGKEGVSVTLVTRYDWRHSCELVRILEEAAQEVPDKLRSMAERYQQKVAENPDGYINKGSKGGFVRKREREREPFFMEDYL